MSLIECAECGRQISDQAPSCPGCGAPPDAYRSGTSEVDLGPAEAQPAAQSEAIESASAPDGLRLWYYPSVRAFIFGDDQLSLDQVHALDAQRALQWTRLDVREQMRRAVKRGAPMDDLPSDPGPGLLERFTDASDKFSAAVSAPPGTGDAAMVCPHCDSQGTIKTKSVKQKKGISGGKATAAVLTGGISLLATGLSRKEQLTEARCAKCGARWTF